MTNSDWWARAHEPTRQQQSIEIRKHELLATLRKGEHAVTLEKRDVPVMGEKLILSVNGHWRRMRVFRDGAALAGTTKDTVTSFEAHGWSVVGEET